MRCVPIGSATIWTYSARFTSDSASLKSRPKESMCVCEPVSKNEGTRSRAHMRVTHVNNAYRGPRALLPESRSFGSQPTYYLFIRTVPGWSATWRNRLREFAEPAFLAQAPSELCFHSFRFSLFIPISFRLFSSLPFRLSSSSTLFWALSLSLFFSLLLYRTPCSLFILLQTHTPSLILSRVSRATLVLSRHQSFFPLPLSLLPLSSPGPLLLSLLCNQNNNNLLRTAHQSDWQPITRYV